MKVNKKFIYLYGLSCGTLALIPTIYNTYWSLFLTSAAGLTTAGMAVVMSIIGIADIISIILVSFIIQKSNLKFGKFRFWVLLGGLAAAVTRVLAFSTFLPGSIAYFSIMIVISSTMFNLAYCAYMGLLPVVANTQDERMLTSTAMQQSVAVFAILVSLVSVTVIKSLSYAALSAFAGVAMFATIIPMYFATKKVDVYKPATAMSAVEKAAQPSLWETIKLTFNIPMLVYLLGSMGKIVGSISLVMLVSYYYTYAFGDMKMLTLYMTLSTVLQLIGATLAPFVNKLVKGNRNTYAAGLFIYAICLAISLVVGGSAILFTIALSVGYMGWAICHTADAAYYSYIGDYVEYKHHKNIQPFLMSMLSMVIKIGIALSSIVVGWGLVSVGFDANNVTDASKSGIKLLTVILPLVVLAIGGIITMFSPLTDKRVKEIKAELEKRHNVESKAG